MSNCIKKWARVNGSNYPNLGIMIDFTKEGELKMASLVMLGLRNKPEHEMHQIILKPYSSLVYEERSIVIGNTKVEGNIIRYEEYSDHVRVVIPINHGIIINGTCYK